MTASRREHVRRAVAREAAWLIYTGRAREYKTAKEMALRALGARVMPSNAEVALELARIIEEFEGKRAEERLVEMRREALAVMRALRPFRPRLIGSVWRGLAREESDIDIEVFSDEPLEVLKALEGAGYRVVRHGPSRAPSGQHPIEGYHIYLELPSGREVEVTVRPEAEEFSERRCEVFGDIVRGLGPEELEALLREEPARKFLPGWWKAGKSAGPPHERG